MEAKAGGSLSIKYEVNFVYTAEPYTFQGSVYIKQSYSKAKPKQGERTGRWWWFTFVIPTLGIQSRSSSKGLKPAFGCAVSSRTA